MNLTVIIPTRNRAALLEKALESLLLQSLPGHNFEVIIADNGSTDLTKKICDEFKNRFTHFKYCYDQTPGLHVGRHRGLKEAASDILVYADDDVQALPTWLEAIGSSFLDPSVMLVGGNNYPLYETDPPGWLNCLWSTIGSAEKCNYLLSVLNFGSSIKRIKPYHVFGCNYAIRKSILLEAGGFHPDGMPQALVKFRGDGESAVSAYILEKGHTALFNPLASIEHYIPRSRMTLAYLKQRSFNQGISDSYTSLRAGNPPLLKKHDAAKMVEILKGFLDLHLLKALRLARGKLAAALSFSVPWQLKRAHCRGYNYHQQEYLRDAHLRQWVHKETYYD